MIFNQAKITSKHPHIHQSPRDLVYSGYEGRMCAQDKETAKLIGALLELKF